MTHESRYGRHDLIHFEIGFCIDHHQTRAVLTRINTDLYINADGTNSPLSGN
jgi:hypothetical protein